MFCACLGRCRFRCGRLVQARPSFPPLRWSCPVSVCLRFSFPLPFQGCPFWARFHVLVFSLSLFFCIPLFASWLSNFHLIFIFISFSFPLFFIIISWSGPYFSPLLREGVCVNHLNRCKTSFCGIFPGFWFVPNNKLQGDHPCTMCDGPTKRPQYMWISRLITVTYLPFFFCDGKRLNPRTSMSSICNFCCTAVAICQGR